MFGHDVLVPRGESESIPQEPPTQRDGRIALELKTPWHDGTRELVFEPLELLTPRPETNLLICLGLLAARARSRRDWICFRAGSRVAARGAAAMRHLGRLEPGTAR